MCERKTRKYTLETDIYKSTSMTRMQMTGRAQEMERGLIVLRNACNETYSKQRNLHPEKVKSTEKMVAAAVQAGFAR